MVTADTEPVTIASRVPWFHAHNPCTRPLWMAIYGTQVCAWLSLNLFYGRPAYNPTAEVSHYVAESHRRRALCRMLLQRIIDQAPARGVNALLGFIWAHNAPSLPLFQVYGFEPWRNLPRVAMLDGIERDLIILRPPRRALTLPFSNLLRRLGLLFVSFAILYVQRRG